MEDLVASAFRYWVKMHLETDCGKPDHWAECEALADDLYPLANKEQKQVIEDMLGSWVKE